jgi:hypothetical protein
LFCDSSTFTLTEQPVYHAVQRSIDCGAAMPPVALPGKEAGYLEDYRRSIMAPDEAGAVTSALDVAGGPPDAGVGCYLGAATELMIPMLTICFRCNARALT